MDSTCRSINQVAISCLRCVHKTSIILKDSFQSACRKHSNHLKQLQRILNGLVAYVIYIQIPLLTQMKMNDIDSMKRHGKIHIFSFLSISHFETLKSYLPKCPFQTKAYITWDLGVFVLNLYFMQHIQYNRRISFIENLSDNLTWLFILAYNIRD